MRFLTLYKKEKEDTLVSQIRASTSHWYVPSINAKNYPKEIGVVAHARSQPSGNAEAG